MEHSNLQLSELGCEISDLYVDCSLLLLLDVVDFTAHAVSCPLVGKEGIDIEPALPQQVDSLLELCNQASCLLLGHLDQKHLIYRTLRWVGLGFAVRVGTHRETAADFGLNLGQTDLLDHHVQVPFHFEGLWLRIFLHFQIEFSYKYHYDYHSPFYSFTV